MDSFSLTGNVAHIIFGYFLTVKFATFVYSVPTQKNNFDCVVFLCQLAVSIFNTAIIHSHMTIYHF